MDYILEVADNGTLTLPSEVLHEAKPHTRYVLETKGEQITLRPQQSESDTAKPRRSHRKKTLSPEEWEAERKALQEALSKVWPEGLSVIDVISEMRR